MEDRLGALEEKLNLLQETLEALPEAISRILPLVQQQMQLQQQQQQQQQPPPETELQRRQQFLHPESSYGSIGGSGGVSHSRSVPSTWTASATTPSQPAAPSTPVP